MSRFNRPKVPLRHVVPGRLRALLLASACLLALAALSTSRRAGATEHHFVSTYESGVLDPGHAELEPWTTWRYGRKNFYNRFDERLEFELGLVEKLQTSLYWNFSAVGQDLIDPATGARTRVTQFEFESLSSEWKYKVTDPVADALGLALYFEGTLGPVEAELEPKVIVDKRAGDLLFAANVLSEIGWEFAQPGGSEAEVALEVDAGLGYFVSPAVAVGLELRQVNKLEDGKLGSSILGVGPTISYAAQSWWGSIGIMPQLVAFKGSSAGSRLDLDTEERLRTRILFGFDI